MHLSLEITGEFNSQRQLGIKAFKPVKKRAIFLMWLRNFRWMGVMGRKVVMVTWKATANLGSKDSVDPFIGDTENKIKSENTWEKMSPHPCAELHNVPGPMPNYWRQVAEMQSLRKWSTPRLKHTKTDAAHISTKRILLEIDCKCLFSKCLWSTWMFDKAQKRKTCLVPKRVAPWPTCKHHESGIWKVYESL